MADYAHAYLTGDLLLLPLWLIAFYWRKDLRKEIVVMSLIGGVLSVIFAPPFLHDYWHPFYLFNKFSPAWPFGGIEDFLNGFFVVGIASVAYEELFRKKLIRGRRKKDLLSKHLIISAIAYGSLFYLLILLGVGSIYSALLSFAALTVWILKQRPDLAMDSFYSGMIMGLITFVGYLLFLKVYPNSVDLFWDKTTLNNYLVLGIPLGELVWAFFIGAASGPLYEFVVGKKFKPVGTRAKR